MILRNIWRRSIFVQRTRGALQRNRCKCITDFECIFNYIPKVIDLNIIFGHLLQQLCSASNRSYT